MANVVVVGAQWGDEGKGKIVDWLSERADVIARFQGGHNAGHTLVIGDKVFKLSLLPSGIVRENKLAVIGNGVVLDPWALFSEIDKLAGQGVAISTENLMIAENTPLILPLHQDLDKLREEAAGKAKIGTTGRGIGPAYEDKVGRRTIRVADLADEETLDSRLDRLLAHHDALRAGLGATPIDRAELKAKLMEGGAQAAALCPARLEDHGRRPQGRKTDPVRGRAGIAAGHRFRHLSLCHLVHDDLGGRGQRHGRGAGRDRLCPWHRQGIHHPRGRRSVPVGTGRRRRPAPWRAGPRVRHRHGPQAPLRLVRRGAVRQTCAISGVNGIALTKLDVLDGSTR